MSTFVGRIETAASQPPAKPLPEAKAEKTRADLVEEAEELGIDVPKGATKAQIQKLIDEAPVM